MVSQPAAPEPYAAGLTYMGARRRNSQGKSVFAPVDGKGARATPDGLAPPAMTRPTPFVLREVGVRP